jgi:hypothetical protein
MAKTLFSITVTEDDLAGWLGEMSVGDEVDDATFSEDLNKVCAAASVDCGGRTALTDWMWRHVSYDYIENELRDAMREYMASTLNREE